MAYYIQKVTSQLCGHIMQHHKSGTEGETEQILNWWLVCYRFCATELNVLCSSVHICNLHKLVGSADLEQQVICIASCDQSPMSLGVYNHEGVTFVSFNAIFSPVSWSQRKSSGSALILCLNYENAQILKVCSGDIRGHSSFLFLFFLSPAFQGLNNFPCSFCIFFLILASAQLTSPGVRNHQTWLHTPNC